MIFTLLLKNEDNSTLPLMVSEIERTGPLTAATLGLTLAESKRLLTEIQHELVQAQLRCHFHERRICSECGDRRTLKDYQSACFKSLFGGVHLRVPRLNGCSCTGQGHRAQTIQVEGAEELGFPGTRVCPKPLGGDPTLRTCSRTSGIVVARRYR